MDDSAPLVVFWERALPDLLVRTARFPKSARFTFAQRLDGLALDVLAALVEARFSSGATKAAALRVADVGLAKLRALLRVSFSMRYLDPTGYEHLSRVADEAGRMLGGWRKQQGS